tara:strand:+ start:4329 stop:5306 length:978 start_codon:yes stop_codon:yes gene_type:complete
MDQETITVVIPAYNSSETICETVDSVLNQTRPPDEIIIVDDCGPDDVQAALGERLDRVKLIRHDTNKGVSSARNTGFSASTSSLISFLDGDDIFFPQFLETAERIFKENTDVSMCFGGFHSAFESQFSSIKDRSIPVNPDVRFYEPETILGQYLHDSTSPLINFGLVRRSAIDTILKDGNVFDPDSNLTGDFNYLLELLLLFKLAYIENPCGIWRLRSGSMSQNRFALWHSRFDSLTAVLKESSLKSISAKSREMLEENKRATARYCGKILAWEGRRMAATTHLLKEFGRAPSLKTAALMVLIALNLKFKTNKNQSADWRGSNIK